jgi:hypothetical protein
MNREDLEQSQKNYRNHLENVVAKCPHDKEIVFAMMGDQTSSTDDHNYVFKCSHCDGHIWHLKHGRFSKMIVTSNEKYLCKWETVTPREDPRLIQFIDKNVYDYARELFIDVSKHTWEDLK